MVHPEGVEPSTSGAEIQRSIQLSYGCKMVDKTNEMNELTSLIGSN
jgi:hypothetical protein